MKKQPEVGFHQLQSHHKKEANGVPQQIWNQQRLHSFSQFEPVLIPRKDIVCIKKIAGNEEKRGYGHFGHEMNGNKAKPLVAIQMACCHIVIADVAMYQHHCHNKRKAQLCDGVRIVVLTHFFLRAKMKFVLTQSR